MNVFDSVPVKVPAKNVFTLDHDVKSTYNFDKLYPFLCQPVYPGDTFNARAEVFLRTMPMFAPIMHNVDMRLYFFFVPNRLIWNENKKRDWKVFITGGEDGLQNPTLPYFTYEDLYNAGAAVLGFMNQGSLADHLGFPTSNSIINSSLNPLHDNTKKERVCSLPFRAYQLVYNEYFRNQNIQNEVEFSFDEGEETAASLRELFRIRKKNWEKDYFTSCLPWAQRGQAMRLPVDVNSSASSDVAAQLSVIVDKAIKENMPATDMHSHSSGGSEQFVALDNQTFSNNDAVKLGGTAEGTITIDMEELVFNGLSIGTISDFRYCLRLQQWLENNARCGSRYIEQLLAHFGVVSSDARLQRPELLGGGKIPLIFTDVEQNSQGDGTSDNVLGNLAGKGVLYGKTNGFKKYFEEHGILLGILTIVPRSSYSQGLPRVWTAFDKTDWYFPEFANLGEQAVLNKEVFFPISNADDLGVSDQDYAIAKPNDVFGYQGRFTELRYIPSSVHGEMKNTLQYWHLGRLFNYQPALNDDFIAADSRVNVFSLEDVSNGVYDPFICQIHMDISAVRPLPKYAVPTI